MIVKLYLHTHMAEILHTQFKKCLILYNIVYRYNTVELQSKILY